MTSGISFSDHLVLLQKWLISYYERQAKRAFTCLLVDYQIPCRDWNWLGGFSHADSARQIQQGGFGKALQSGMMATAMQAHPNQ
jgi:hypothetical protein